MPVKDTAIVMERINIEKKYKSFGFTAKEIKKILEEDHAIVVSQRQVEEDITNINQGKYAETYLDLLLEVNYPHLFEETLKGLFEDLKKMADLGDHAELESIKLKAITNHARLQLDILNTLHKGAVVRAMKQLSTKAKILLREVLQQDSMIKNRSQLSVITDSQLDLNKKVVTFDENMQRVEEEMIEIDPDLQKKIG